MLHQFKVSELPQPKFAIGQYVCHCWVCDDELDSEMFGRMFRDHGLIIGMLFEISNRYRPGWVYQISFDSLESYDFETPYLNQVEEDEIVLA